MELDTITTSDALTFLRGLPDESVHCIITSPPYFGLRDYGVSGQIGLEQSPHLFVSALVDVFREARRVLRNDGTCWINIGDSYSGSGKGKPTGSKSGKQLTNAGSLIPRVSTRYDGVPSKNLMLVPFRLAIALQDDGWILRSDIIWSKPSVMPESVNDRPTKSHEYIFLLTKSKRYWYDNCAIQEPSAYPDDNRKARQSQDDYDSRAKGDRISTINPLNPKAYLMRNRRTVWNVANEPTSFAHFATFPQALIEPMILAGCPTAGVVLDPFMGSGTTALVARDNGRHYIGCDLNAEYVALARDRIKNTDPYQSKEVQPGIVQQSLFEAV